MGSSVFQLSSLGRQVLQRYHNTSASTRLYLSARWRWTPYEHIANQVPRAGLILDLGAGHGLLSLAMSLGAKERTVLGIDHDPVRVSLAQQAADGIPNVKFVTGTLETALDKHAQPGAVACIVVMDAMHYLPRQAQERFVRRARQVLQPGGMLLIRDVDASAGGTFWINRLHEKVMTGFGANCADQLNFRTQAEWLDLLRAAGFECASEKCSRFPFADCLFRCVVPAMEMVRAA